MDIETILKKITKELALCPFIKGVVLGGSRATGMANEKSDIDIGIYYKQGNIDYSLLNAIAGQLDDTHRENLICREGEWGKWVNCGGWLVINGYHVDFIMRDYAKVESIVEQTDKGEFSSHYQTGHPHAYLDVMYRGELASCKVLYAADSSFSSLKKRAEEYPAALKNALLDFFLFESGFSCMLAEKSIDSGDIYYLMGHLFRSVSALNQSLFALNEQWCLNEKKAVFRIDSFRLSPLDFSKRVANIFELFSDSPISAVQKLKELCNETESLCRKDDF